MHALYRLADALQPPSVKGRDWKRRAHLYVLRLGCLLSAVLFPAFGVFYRAEEPGAVDPWVLRVLIAVGALGLFVWSHRSDWVKQRAVALQLAIACVVTVWCGWLMGVNGLSANYAIGYLGVCVGVALLLSVGFDRAGPLVLYLAFTAVVTVTVLAYTPVGGVSPLIFAACLLLVTALVYVAVSARAQMQEALEEREAQLAEAQRTAGLGNWEWDAATDRSVWSAEMFHLLGLDAERDRPSLDALTAHVHFDDRPAVTRYFADLLAGRQPADLTVRVGREDGGIRAVRLRGTREGGGLKPTRLFGVLLDVTPEIERAAALVAAKEQAEAARRQETLARHEAEAALSLAEMARTEAEAARAHAEEMARLKSAFLANMSHEIRTPLTAIIGFAQVLGEEVGEHQRDLVAPIEQGGRRLLDTLNSVLDLARLQSGRYQLTIEPVDVAEEAHSLGDLLRPLAQQKGVALVVHAPPNGLWLDADRSALQRVLTNLLSNAVKFTDAGRITLSADAVGGRIRLRVRDTGRGISAAFLPKLFEEFHQESTGLTRSHEGSGLGLAITRQLVEMMGGQIHVESEVGVGTLFTVALPRAAATEAVAPPADAATVAA